MNKLKQLTDIYNWKFSRTQNETGQRSKEDAEWIGVSPINPELISDAAADLARITAERDELYKLVEHLKEMNDDALMNGGGAWSRGGATDQRVNAALKQSS